MGVLVNVSVVQVHKKMQTSVKPAEDTLQAISYETSQATSISTRTQLFENKSIIIHIWYS
jgi:hypothetical protein